jgi:hypothetical protein
MVRAVADAPLAAIPAVSRVGIPRNATALFLPEHDGVELEAWNALRPHPEFGCGPMHAMHLGDAVRSPGGWGRRSPPPAGPPRRPGRPSSASAAHRAPPRGRASRHRPPHHPGQHTTLPGQETATRITAGLAQQVLDLDECLSRLNRDPGPDRGHHGDKASISTAGFDAPPATPPRPSRRTKPQW